MSSPGTRRRPRPLVVRVVAALVMWVATSPPEAAMRSTTTTASTLEVSARATSTVGLSASLPRATASAVTTPCGASLMRPASESAEKPPNTTEGGRRYGHRPAR